MDSEPRRSSEKRIGLIAASIACLVSLCLALWTFWPSGGKRADPSPSVPNADAVALESSMPKAADAERLLDGPEAGAIIERSMDDAGLDTLDLTPVEKRQIAQLACEGLGNRKIAFDLGISPATVNVHLGTVYRKTGAQNRTELTRLVLHGKIENGVK